MSAGPKKVRGVRPDFSKAGFFMAKYGEMTRRIRVVNCSYIDLK
ncbi:S-layer domain-containing protein [Thermoclostridium stercorarium subsp. stercorarium DSM 8532]|uniref:S-layer domain-containing protein n=1 Tax=Thermoclostridium stercorarium (strain ATCC 35414 / DSM 8532 / NCIMB 11754) TaxID=1121335 RepID=L7VNP7_THES1|nr:S-layer domain-containing protein [Thermoclostridium stercorarium subsp. stercorarium DSM 8532]